MLRKSPEEDEFAAWLARNLANLDRFVIYLDNVEDLIDLPGANWEQLSVAKNQVTDLLDQIAKVLQIISPVANTPMYLESARDDIVAQVASLQERAIAVQERLREADLEITRRLGEVGSAHDRRPVEQKGAHRLYR